MSSPTPTTQPAAAPVRRLSAVLEGAAPPSRATSGIVAVAAARIAILAILFLALHQHQVRLLKAAWLEDPNWGHGLLIPLFCLYLLYARRNEIVAAPRRTYWPGLALMIVALVWEVVAATIIQNYWLWGLGMVAMLFALVLYLCGPAAMRLLWLPIVMLALGVPLAGDVYTRIATPLQELAARDAVGTLSFLGVEFRSQAHSSMTLISRSGIPRPITVAEACAGMRLLMAFLALGVAIAYLEARPLWQRVVLVAMGVPIAVFCNVLRVCITAWMFYIDHEEWGSSVMHFFTGMLMLIPAFGLLWVLGRLLRLPGWLGRKLYVEEDEPPQGTPPSPVPEKSP